jgi:hypothetical protein
MADRRACPIPSAPPALPTPSRSGGRLWQSCGPHGLCIERQGYAQTSCRKARGGSVAKAREHSTHCVGGYAQGGHVAGGDPRRDGKRRIVA